MGNMRTVTAKRILSSTKMKKRLLLRKCDSLGLKKATHRFSVSASSYGYHDPQSSATSFHRGTDKRVFVHRNGLPLTCHSVSPVSNPTSLSTPTLSHRV